MVMRTPERQRIAYPDQDIRAVRDELLTVEELARAGSGKQPPMAGTQLSGPTWRQFFVSQLALVLAVALIAGERIVPHNWWPVVGLAIGSQLIGQGLLVYSMGYLSPVVVGLGLLTQPAVSAMVGWSVYGERLGMTDAAGALLVCAALVLIRLPERSDERKGSQT